MGDEYHVQEVFPVAVPQWAQAADGTWIREWEVRLEAAPDEQRTKALDRLSEEGISVTATVVADGRTVHVRTVTALNPLADDVFHGAAYRMLRKIDQDVGRIEAIQGQPRKVWQPFR